MDSVVNTLQRDGIAFSTAADLSGAELWQEVQAATAAQIQASQTALTFAREGRLKPMPGQATRVHKTYLLKLLGECPHLDPSSVWGRLAEHPAMLECAAQYLEDAPVLKAFNVWYTLPCSQSRAPSDSQLWHRDEDDTRIFKVFLYLTDVTLACGPLTYIPGTHAGKASWHPKLYLDYANVPRATDGAMMNVVPEAEWVRATGDVGTVVLADTTGWHKGGYGTEDRVLFTALYTTAKATCRTHFLR